MCYKTTPGLVELLLQSRTFNGLVVEETTHANVGLERLLVSCYTREASVSLCRRRSSLSRERRQVQAPWTVDIVSESRCRPAVLLASLSTRLATQSAMYVRRAHSLSFYLSYSSCVYIPCSWPVDATSSHDQYTVGATTVRSLARSHVAEHVRSTVSHRLQRTGSVRRA